ncbi:hypothetical protein GUJ74_25160|uniref:hypothetical protein n=1 Tax=Escherichia coli TaxID=562 RepID=UPI0014447B63|nr:hypothetical protein [Escherichia coli]NKQ99695.1 hypothetical protein [Escherichia coli]
MLVIMVFTATAQKQTKYYLIPQAALLNGDHACNAQLQLVGGIQKKQWGFGAGLGIDYYKVRTIPLFVDTRFFFGKERQYFSYFNLG